MMATPRCSAMVFVVHIIDVSMFRSVFISWAILTNRHPTLKASRLSVEIDISYVLGYIILLIIPGKTMTKNGNIFKYDARSTPPCAWERLLAAKDL